MKNFQSCASLPVDTTRYTRSNEPLRELFEMQLQSQREVYHTDFLKMQERLGDVREYLDWNYHAIQDELREFFTALGGIDTHGNAIWKPWKKAFTEAQNKPLIELTDNEVLELWYELVDVFHFFINMCLAVGLKPETLFNLYCAKSTENKLRQLRGY